MQIFDASSMIYAWDNYPLGQFPKVWNWIAKEISKNRFCISAIAFDEVNQKTSGCGKWLRESEIQRVAVTNEILQESLRIKDHLGIKNDQFHSSGVGENDILIISTAKIEGIDLICDERRQPIKPKLIAKYRMPAVCSLATVMVECHNFLEVLKMSDETF